MPYIFVRARKKKLKEVVAVILDKYKKLLKDCVGAVKEIYNVKELKEEHIRTVNTLFIQVCRKMELEGEFQEQEEEEKATERQMRLLSHFGVINLPRELTKKEASLLIEIIRKNKRSLILNLQKDLEGGNNAYV